MPRARFERKRAFPKAASEKWVTAEAGETTTLAPTNAQAQWPAERRLLYDVEDRTVHRVAHVGYHEEHKCVVAWIYEMTCADTVMPKVAGKKLNQDLCDVCTVADAETMIRDYHDALERDELPFEINL